MLWGNGCNINLITLQPTNEILKINNTESLHKHFPSDSGFIWLHIVTCVDNFTLKGQGYIIIIFTVNKILAWLNKSV